VSWLAQSAELQECTMLTGLRQQTKLVHEQLHHHSHFVALFEQTIDLQQYRDLLERFYGFYAALDDAIALSIGVNPDAMGGFIYAKRKDLLAQDLRSLGLTPAKIALIPRCDQMFDVVSPATLGGVLYVIEGSTLGAAQIDRAAQKLLSRVTQNGRHFWAWARAHNKVRWSMTLDYILHLDEMAVAQDPVNGGANDTFQALADWLAPLDQPIRLVESVHS
jgi:heme oxygenase